MPSKKSNATQNAIKMLKADHTMVKELFDEFEETENAGKKRKIMSDAISALKVHATVEEQLFYPALRQVMEDEDDLLEEADEEHHVAKILIAELDQMDGSEDNFEAKFTVLAESVRHHIKEEEGNLFPKARETDIDFNTLGAQMADLKARLSQEGVPPDAEAKMIAKTGLRGDSPAKQAQEKVDVPRKVA